MFQTLWEDYFMVKKKMEEKEKAERKVKVIPESGIVLDRDVIYKGKFYFKGTKVPKEIADYVKR